VRDRSTAKKYPVSTLLFGVQHCSRNPASTTDEGGSIERLERAE
jgi:hypothetical protein